MRPGRAWERGQGEHGNEVRGKMPILAEIKI